jgi:hypothetical protein
MIRDKDFRGVMEGIFDLILYLGYSSISHYRRTRETLSSKVITTEHSGREASRNKCRARRAAYGQLHDTVVLGCGRLDGD